jgi:hypothetical protein
MSGLTHLAEIKLLPRCTGFIPKSHSQYHRMIAAWQESIPVKLDKKVRRKHLHSSGQQKLDRPFT